MINDNVLKELDKILNITDPELLSKIKPEVIVQDILKDLTILNDLMEQEKIDAETVIKILNAKGIKQKLLGQAIGMWKAEQPQEREKSAADLLAQLRKSSVN